ncbi:MAG: glycerol acyltransferase [Mesorhizobium amorphae]|nr:MAG: glycerol acyltransferase [Mesorhizobium amorphae]
MRFAELSYANPSQSRLQRAVIRTAEGLSGRNHYADRYDWWRRHVFPTGDRVFGRMLALADISLECRGSLPEGKPHRPLVVVANHPFGIGDGIALLSLVERLGRPFRVMIHADLLRVSEMEGYSLPVDFTETKEAQKRNLAMRQEALRLLAEGTVVVIFPAGGVATAPKLFGQADDLPWKLFTAKLIQEAKADVLPVHFSGQNGVLFHAVSRFSSTLRLSLLIREFRKLAGKTIHATAGTVIGWEEMAAIKDRKVLMAYLRERVFALGSGASLSRPRRPRLPLRWRAPRLPRRLPALP